MSECRFDVVVVGAGLAGLAAAIRCVEQGLSVAVLERGSQERYPCNSRFAAGIVHCANQDIRADPAVLRRAIDQQTRGFADPELAQLFARNAGTAVRWLVDQGVRMIKGGWEPGRRTVLAPPPPMRAGHHWRGRGADLMVWRLNGKLQERGGKLIRNARARQLIMEGARCIGVAAIRGGDNVQMKAAAVVLADGGFQADHEFLTRYITREPDRLLQRNAKTGTGDGIRMAMAVGAQVRGMDRFYGHVQSRDAMNNPMLWPFPTADAVILTGLAVNSRGRRFADEGLGGVYMANSIAGLEDPLEAAAIFDHGIWKGAARKAVRPPNPLLEKAGGTVHRSDTLEGLAVAAGLPVDAVIDTVAQFNRAIEEGAGDRLDPPRTAAVHKPARICSPPFYALPLCAGITYTMGGVAIDAQCRVLHSDGRPVPGLFAAGATTGGHEGGPVAGFTGGLSKAVTFGLQAGDCIGALMRSELVPRAAR